MQIHVTDEDRPEFRISGDSSWSLFEEVAAAIQGAFDGRWAEQVDGVDQRYWDLLVDDACVTLHLEHHLGISLFPSHAASNEQASADLARRISRFLASYAPSA